MVQIFYYEYGTNIEDAIVAVYQWADILGVEYENDDLFFTAKELISANIDFVDWNQLKDMRSNFQQKTLRLKMTKNSPTLCSVFVIAKADPFSYR